MKVYGTGNPKVVRKITQFWQSKELLLPFEPADAKRSTKCVAGSHFKVLLILFLPICCIIVASPGEQGSNEA